MRRSNQAGDQIAAPVFQFHPETSASTADIEDGVLARGNPTEVAGMLLCFASLRGYR